MREKELLIFDVDGTLTQTACMDSEAYISAFKSYLNIESINSNWDEYHYSTDSGFAIELFEKHISRSPYDEEIKAIKQSFFNRLEEKISKDPACCQGLPGTSKLFDEITSLGRWDIAIATGCWRNSALIKLEYANLLEQLMPMASGDDHIERHEIIKIAINRAKAHYRQDQYKTIVYVGDRLWDYNASQKLNIQFIGVGKVFSENKFENILRISDYHTDDFFCHLNKF